MSATCARAGIPDHLDRSPLNSIRTAASSGPLTAAWHARPLAAPAELSNKSGIDALLQGARGDCGGDLTTAQAVPEPRRRHHFVVGARDLNLGPLPCQGMNDTPCTSTNAA